VAWDFSWEIISVVSPRPMTSSSGLVTFLKQKKNYKYDSKISEEVIC
jgi:hypothetical protein